MLKILIPPILFLLLAITVKGYSYSFMLKDSTDRDPTVTRSEKNYPEIKCDASKIYSESDRRVINNWYSHYHQISNALANDNSVDARIHALALVDAMESSLPELQKNNITSTELSTFSNSLSGMRMRISEATDIDAQRILFGILNENMMPFLKVSGMYERNVYILYCPEDVAYSNSYWFSDSMTSGNPYTGTAGKSDCVMVKEYWQY